MDFFRQQEIARRNTRRLIALFLLAVLALIVITNLLFIGLLTGGDLSYFFEYFDWSVFIVVGAFVAMVIGVVLVNWLLFARGGSKLPQDWEALCATCH